MNFTIDTKVSTKDGLELTLGNLISVFMANVREQLEGISWSVLSLPFTMTGDAIRKRAKRLDGQYVQYVYTEEGQEFEFEFTSEGKAYEIHFCLLTENQLQFMNIQELGKATTVVPKKKAVEAVKEVVEEVKPATLSDRVHTQFMMTPNSIVIVKDGQPVIVNHDHINFNRIKAQLEEDSTYQPKLLEPVRILEEFSHMGLSYKDGQIKLDGYNFKSQMFDRLVKAIQDNETEDALKRLFAFVRRALNHPDKVTSERIFDFARHNSIEITEDGMLIGYKKVRSDYKDIHSGTFDNSPGNVLEMPRQTVEADHNKTCAPGLHFAAKHYLPHFGSSGSGDRVVRVMVDPADIVGIPFDYADSKCRTCKYVVLDDVTDKMK